MRQATDIIRTTGLCVAICLLANACAENYTPKPRGYFRIEPEQAIYQPLSSPDLPYMFEVSTKVSMDNEGNALLQLSTNPRNKFG